MTTKPTYRASRERHEIDRCELQKRVIEAGRIHFHVSPGQFVTAPGAAGAKG